MTISTGWRPPAGPMVRKSYTYDAAGNVLTATYPSGRIVTYTRDALGRISSVTTKQNSGATAVNVATSVVVGYEYSFHEKRILKKYSEPELIQHFGSDLGPRFRIRLKLKLDK